MKNIIYKFRLLEKCALLLLVMSLASCDESFLEEIPKDILVPENAYSDVAGFEAGLVHLHQSVRYIWIGDDNPAFFFLFGLGSDYAGYGEGFYDPAKRMDYAAISSTDGEASRWWNHFYGMVKNANVIITRAENPDIDWGSDIKKNEIVAEAKFMRAYAYRSLGHLFGGAILMDKEITGIKVDGERATRKETYEFAIKDLEFAALNLPETTEQDGRVVQAAANHLLAELYISTQQWQKAIDAASRVIDNPNYELMKERFGTRQNEPGDVYWDLFRLGNQNTSGGNTENIWSIQIEYQTPGGGSNTGAKGLHVERAWGTRYHSIKDPNGENGFVLSDEYGRPVGWCVPTPYLANDIWDIDQDGEYDPDMRNSMYNIHRVDRGQFIYNNPSSAYFGTPVSPETVASQELRYWHPYFMKNTTPNKHADGIFNVGRIYRDVYVMRLAETYLLRAEAYLGADDKEKAALDINVVRARANAIPVEEEDVDIDYILDERARELSMEEQRLLTLQRLGLQYERTKKLNPWGAGKTIEPHNNLWPIPQSDIDLNTGAVIEQNPGYE